MSSGCLSCVGLLDANVQLADGCGGITVSPAPNENFLWAGNTGLSSAWSLNLLVDALLSWQLFTTEMSLPPYNPNSQGSAYPNILPPDRNHPQFQEQSQPHSYQFTPNQNQPYPPAQYGVPMTRPAAVDDKSNKRVRVSRAW